MAPFLAALAVITVVVIGIVLFNVLGGDGLSEQERVGRAAVGQNDALQRRDFTDFGVYTCRDQLGDKADFLSRQEESVDRHGARYVDDVADVVIDGDRASATVTYHFDKTPDTKTGVPTSFVREDGAWKVCSTEPS